MLYNQSQQQHHHRGDDRQQITRAREAAEALFRPKRQLIEPSVPGTTPPSAASSARKPRVLTIAPPAPVHTEREAPIRPKQMTPLIPRSQFARVRTWVEYGMTASQVAEVYGVSIGEVERILRKA